MLSTPCPWRPAADSCHMSVDDERGRAIRALPDAGSVVIDSAAARALRTRGTALTLGGVLGCAGGFVRGGAIHLIQRGVDGGQRAVAKAVANLDAAEIERLLESPDRSSAVGEVIVVQGDELVLF